MAGYKVKEAISGFYIWELKDYGNGYAWEKTGIKFQTKEDAKNYINELKKRSNKNDSDRESY